MQACQRRGTKDMEYQEDWKTSSFMFLLKHKGSFKYPIQRALTIHSTVIHSKLHENCDQLILPS